MSMHLNSFSSFQFRYFRAYWDWIRFRVAVTKAAFEPLHSIVSHWAVRSLSIYAAFSFSIDVPKMEIEWTCCCGCLSDNIGRTANALFRSLLHDSQCVQWLHETFSTFRKHASPMRQRGGVKARAHMALCSPAAAIFVASARNRFSARWRYSANTATICWHSSDFGVNEWKINIYFENEDYLIGKQSCDLVSFDFWRSTLGSLSIQLYAMRAFAQSVGTQVFFFFVFY